MTEVKTLPPCDHDECPPTKCIMTELKPCPFQKLAHHRIRIYHDGFGYAGECFECGFRLKQHYNEQDAVASWNTRHDTSPPKEMLTGETPRMEVAVCYFGGISNKLEDIYSDCLKFACILERELIATQAALKECAEALQKNRCWDSSAQNCKWLHELTDKALSNPLVQQAMKGK